MARTDCVLPRAEDGVLLCIYFRLFHLCVTAQQNYTTAQKPFELLQIKKSLQATDNYRGFFLTCGNLYGKVTCNCAKGFQPDMYSNTN